MAQTAIEWADFSWSPWEGCQKVSEGCKNCYAAERDERFHNGQHWGVNSVRKIMSESYWKQPLVWNRKAEREKTRFRVFPSLCDPFEDKPELIDPRHRFMQLIEATPNLDWLLLTKRPENVDDMVPVKWFGDGFPANLWLGTSVENQEQADKRIPELLKIPAAVRFLSCEPLLGDVKWLCAPDERPQPRFVGTDHEWIPKGCIDTAIDWVIVGGESGSNARPMHPEWVRSLRNQAMAADIPFFFKQWGNWAPMNEVLPGVKGIERRSLHCGTPNNNITVMLRVKNKHQASQSIDGKEWKMFPIPRKTSQNETHE